MSHAPHSTTLPTTVYFDTSFWVRLREATDSDAREVVDALNELQVRYALSRLHIIELMAYQGEGLELIADRARLFAEPPLLVDADASFEILRAPAPYRSKVIDEISAYSDAGVLGGSLALEARRSGRDQIRLMEIGEPATEAEAREVQEIQARREELLAASMEMLRSFGLADAQGSVDFGALFARLGMPQFAGHGRVNLVKPMPPDPVRQAQMLSVAQRISATVAPEHQAWVDEQHALADAAFKDDERPRDLVVGRATPEDARQVRNTGRDIDHMHHFMGNLESIRFLQLDNEQNVAMRTNPEHPIRIRELESRCFTAGTLQRAVVLVGKLISRLS